MVEMTDDSIKHRHFKIDCKYTKEINERKKRLHIITVNFIWFFYRNYINFDWPRVSNLRQKRMTDICSTDFARINLNKLIFAVAVEIVLKLAISKMIVIR